MLSFAFFTPVTDFIAETKVLEQIKAVEAQALFTNPWFLVPFIALVGYMLYKQAWRDLIIMAVFIGIWYASGTEYMQTLVVGDELQISKILPVVFGGAIALGLVIYLLINRD